MGGSQQQSPVLLARIAEKKAELANLKDLQALSGGLADQMQMLADKLSTLSDGTEGMSGVARRKLDRQISQQEHHTNVAVDKRSQQCYQTGIMC